MPLEDHPISEKIISLLHLNHGDKRCIMRYGIVFFASMSLRHILQKKELTFSFNYLLSSTTCVNVQGIQFNVGCYIKLNGEQDLFPRLATVKEILVVDDSKFLVVKQVKIVDYSHHHMAYRTDAFYDEEELISVSDLDYKFPLYVAKVHRQKYLQIRNFAGVELDI